MKFEQLVRPPLEAALNLAGYIMNIVAPEKPTYEPTPASIQYYHSDPEDLVA